MRFKLLSMLKTHYEAYNPMKVVIFFVQEVMPRCFRANYLPTYQAVMLSLGYIVYLTLNFWNFISLKMTNDSLHKIVY